MSDYIATLPVDDEPLPESEKKLMNSLLTDDTNPKSTFTKFVQELKMPILFGILFVVLGSSTTGDIIASLVPYAKSSEMSSLVARAFLFAVLVFMYNNLHIVMK